MLTNTLDKTVLLFLFATVLASCAESGSGTNILGSSYLGAPAVDADVGLEGEVGGMIAKECGVNGGNIYEEWEGTWQLFAYENTHINQRTQLKKAVDFPVKGGVIPPPTYTFYLNGRFEVQTKAVGFENPPPIHGTYAVTDAFRYAMIFDEYEANQRGLTKYFGTWLISDTTLFLMSDDRISMVLKRVVS